MQLITPTGEVIEYDDSEFWEYYDEPGYELDYSEILEFLEPLVADEWRVL